MTTKEFENVIDKIKPVTNYIYMHIKGEPLLHSDFPTLIKICENKKINVNITTNGTLIEKQIETLLTRGKDCGIWVIRSSKREINEIPKEYSNEDLFPLNYKLEGGNLRDSFKCSDVYYELKKTRLNLVF